ncbi:LysR family transcriptional regulator [Trinickia dinghuensis]|uniref:LysR family transcriptional regulator n=1 Tax=Trinickia dinghuensis TaxID=2291023 RepID=A0A3D8K7R7_9BURK|nr:LysR family transcriptional regulator [Trinickia dinghuensis]RDV00946.1 LysR family transcriptional regulator [Trinickia dinghuensis]
MNLKFLETFIWVAKLRSFSLAAEKLHSTQAAISSRISVLEEELGAKLFKREPKGVSLTRAGERVLHHAELVSRSMTELYTSVQDENLAAGTIRIGAMDSAIHSWFVDFVADATHHYPNLDIEVTTETALNLNEQLRRGMLDLVIQTDMVRDETLRSVEVLELSIDWIAAADSDIPGKQEDETMTAALRRLGAERLITYSRHSRPHQDLLRLMQSYGVNEARVSCMNSLAAMIQLTQAGFGVAAMPSALVQDLLHNGGLRKLEGLESPPPLPFVITWRTGTNRAERLVEIAKETVRKFAERVGNDAARVIG